MVAMRLGVTAPLTATVLWLLLATAPAQASSSLRACGSTGIPQTDDVVAVAARGITCRQARNVALTWLRSDRRPRGPRGWRCADQGLILRCVKKQARLRLTTPCFADDCEPMRTTVAQASPDEASRSISAQLDGDRALERVEKVETDGIAPAADGCSYVQIVDGSRDKASHVFRQRRRALRLRAGAFREGHDRGWACRGGLDDEYQRWPRHPNWGAHVGRAFSTSDIQRDSGIDRRRSVLLLPQATVLAARRGLRELKIGDGVHEADDALCCPSFYRTRRFRWNGRRLALVPGSTLYRRCPCRL